MKQVVMLLSVLFILSCSEYSGQKSIGDKEWIASWIQPNDLIDTLNTWSAYRKTFEANEKGSAYIRLAVDSKYWLWLNDSLIVREGQLKRGPTPHSTYYDELDISPYLSEGENTLAILSWYFGKDGFSHKSSGKQGIIAEIWQEDRLMLGSDSTWKAIPHPAFSGLSAPPYPNWRLSESNI
ncbi:MAG: hypothetical protein WBA74_05600, partial [Cyclobacteriaceae bacterium]